MACFHRWGGLYLDVSPRERGSNRAKFGGGAGAAIYRRAVLLRHCTTVYGRSVTFPDRLRFGVLPAWREMDLAIAFCSGGARAWFSRGQFPYDCIVADGFGSERAGTDTRGLA